MISKITEKDVRMRMMDRPENNTLVSGVRWTSEDIDRAIYYCVDAFNMFLPPTGNSYSVENFPYRYLLLTGVAGFLLRSAAVGDASNNLSYSSDGVAINDRDKAAIFSELGNAFWNEFKTMGEQIKISKNVNALLGGDNSEYANWNT